MDKKRVLKLFFLTIVTFSALYFFWNFINSNLLKSKAGTDKVTITYSGSSISVNKNANFNFGISLSADNSKKISAVDLTIKYDDANLIDYTGYQTLVSDYFNQKIVEATTSANGVKTLRLVLTSKKEDSSLSGSVTLNLAFKAKNIDGKTSIGVIGKSQVVGTADSYSFDLNLPSSNATVIIGSGSSTSTPTPTPDPSTGNAKLTLQVRFQGITSIPSTTTTQTAKIIIKKQETTIDEGTINFNYDTMATESAVGTWIGTGYFDIPAGSGYYILIKGPKHVQKKICVNSPTEGKGLEGTYSCSVGNITINKDTTTLDFSNIMLLAGDLPGQDGVVNSYDISLVQNNLGSTDSNILAKADINLDGRINTQDYSLIIYALSIRTDEE